MANPIQDPESSGFKILLVNHMKALGISLSLLAIRFNIFKEQPEQLVD